MEVLKNFERLGSAEDSLGVVDIADKLEENILRWLGHVKRESRSILLVIRAQTLEGKAEVDRRLHRENNTEGLREIRKSLRKTERNDVSVHRDLSLLKGKP